MLGVKGVGEIGIVGTAAATRMRSIMYRQARDLPITLDKLMRLTR